MDELGKFDMGIISYHPHTPWHQQVCQAATYAPKADDADSNAGPTVLASAEIGALKLGSVP